MFGLMKNPGEILLVSAPILSRLIGSKKSINIKDLSTYSYNQKSDFLNAGLPLWPVAIRFHLKEWFILLDELMHHGYPLNIFGGPGGHGYLSNCDYCLDLYEFSRAWTQLSLGEITCFRNSVVNQYADAFSGFLLRSAGFEEIPLGQGDDLFGDREFDGTMAVLLMHLDLTEEE
jgi:hypothetical protein